MADQPIHATSNKGTMPGETIPVVMKASTPAEDSYDAIQSSKTVQEVTYQNRMEALSEKLGNKDSVKG